MEVKTLHDHLVNGHIKALEEVLNLKEAVGFGNDYFDFNESDWDEGVEGESNEQHYLYFLNSAYSYPSLVGTFVDEANKLKHTITVILYHKSYHVQVETKNNVTHKTEYYTNVYKDYLNALRFAYGVVKGV